MESPNLSKDTMDISKLKVPDLKRELKARGLSRTGNKSELMEKLQKAMKNKIEESVIGESVDDLEEDLLNDDDDEHLDGSDPGIADLDSTIEVPTVIVKPQKRKSSESSHDEDSKEKKKVILKRKPSSSDEQTPNGLDAVSKTDLCFDVKKVIKLSELSAKERLEMRAKKFGVSLPAEAKKVVRAERFGTHATITATPVTTNKLAPAGALNVDTLKQRAERFGSSVSSVMTKLNNDERLEKRKQRFGVTNGASETDKAKERMERFKMPVK